MKELTLRELCECLLTEAEMIESLQNQRNSLLEDLQGIGAQTFRNISDNIKADIIKLGNQLEVHKVEFNSVKSKIKV